MGLGKGGDGLGEIGVGGVVFGNEVGEEGDEGFGVEGKELFDGEGVGGGEVEYEEMWGG